MIGQDILLVEDHQLLAQSLAFTLTAEGFAVTVADLTSADHVANAFAELESPIVLLDLDLGGQIGDGSALIELLSRGARVIVVTGNADPIRHALCLELGAIAVLPKSMPYEQLVVAVLAVAEGNDLITDSERHARLTELRAWRLHQRDQLAPFQQLTQREAQVLEELMEGRGCERIAGAWHVSEATVRTQIRGVLTKLGTTSQLAAVAQAKRVGWGSAA